MGTDRALIIFVKSPVRGKVKTRLAATLGDDAALRVYHRLLAITAKATAEVDATRYLFIDGEDVFDELFPHSKFEHSTQGHGDLGVRMKTAFNTVLKAGAKHAVIIGSDLPDLTATEVESAFDALGQTDVVLGPARDGGYYLLGMDQVHDRLFDDLPWSTEDLLVITKDRMVDAGIAFTLMEERNDIDTELDLIGAGWQ